MKSTTAQRRNGLLLGVALLSGSDLSGRRNHLRPGRGGLRAVVIRL